MSRLRIAYIVIFTLLISLAVSIVSAEAGKVRIYDVVEEDGTFQIFEDGVTYKVIEGSGFLYDAPDVRIIHNGIEFDCLPDGYHSNQWISPFCIEIILRSAP